MKAALISVPHSGTRLLRDRTLRPWLGHLVTGHAYIDDVDPAKFDVIIIPLRHPARVRNSWYRRGKFKDKVNPHRWRHCWDVMMAIEDAYYVHVDLPRIREAELKVLEDVLRVSLDHDWSPHANSTTHDVALSQCPWRLDDADLEHFYWRTAKCPHV